MSDRYPKSTTRILEDADRSPDPAPRERKMVQGLPVDEDLVEGVAGIRAAMAELGWGLWSERTVRRWLASGLVPGHRIGRRWQTRRTDLLSDAPILRRRPALGGHPR
jgi:hypothetical protein